MLTRGLAVQLGKDNMRVNAICPGPVDATAVYPEMSSSLDDPGEIFTEGPIPRSGTVEEMANSALFLVSPEAAYTSGIALAVDGGGAAK